MLQDCSVPAIEDLALGSLLRLRRLELFHSTHVEAIQESGNGEDHETSQNLYPKLQAKSLISRSPLQNTNSPNLFQSKTTVDTNDQEKSHENFLNSIKSRIRPNNSFGFSLEENSLPDELEYLKISNVGITFLPEKALCSLKTLIELNLSHNLLQNISQLGYSTVDSSVIIIASPNQTITQNITKDVNYSTSEDFYTTPLLADDPNSPHLECSASLQSLILNHNQLAGIHSKALALLTNLKKLIIDSNHIDIIAKDAFTGLISLDYLSLSNNQIFNLHNETFTHCLLLTKLFLSNNSIHKLEAAVFSSLTELQVLDLSGNRLKFKENEATVFNKLSRLVILDLAHNLIDSVWSSMFKGLSYLQRLDLSHNELANLDAGSFSNMINLYELDISNNKLITLHSSLFYGLVGLSSINLNNNSIGNIGSAIFQSVSNLRELHLSSNNLTTIPKALLNLSFMKTLDLSWNNISLIYEKSFDGLANLIHLNLSSNKIQNLTLTAFEGISSLLSIDLSDNNLTHIEEEAFLILTNLQVLKISKNNLTDMDGLFAGMEKLLVLDISQNKISKFDYAFLPRQLLELNLSHNRVHKLGNHYEVHNFLKLSKLNVSFNNLTILKEISLPNSIDTAILNHNAINKIDAGTFHDKTNLHHLDLSYNNLQKISPFAVKKKWSLKGKTNLRLLLAGNPLVCDCEMSWLYSPSTVHEMEEMLPQTTETPHIRPNILDVSDAYCSLAHVHDRTNNSVIIRVADTVPENYLCPYATHCFALCHCCDYIACDCQMQCPESCTCFHDDTWTMNLVDCSYGNLDRLPSRVPMDATVVYLDGNNLKVLHAHHFIGRHSIQTLFLNGSNIGILQNRTFHGLRALKVLHLHDNMLVHLNGFEFSGLRHLVELYLQNNRLSFVNNATFTGLKSLEVLNIRNNFIVDFPVWLLRSNRHLSSVSFSNNPWDCSCQFVKDLRNWIIEFPYLLTEPDDAFCVFGSSDMLGFSRLVEDYPCSDALHGVTRYEFSQQDLPLLAGCICGLVSVIIAVIFTVVYMHKRKGNEVNKLGMSTTVTTFSQHDDQNKIFDVYISYSSRDVSFVRDVLVNRLEHTMPRYKVCLHSQDFAESALLGEFITQSIAFSRRAMIVLSKNYVENEWKSPIFMINHVNGFANRESSIITINFDGIPESNLDSSLKGIIKKTSKIKWGDNNFWKQIYELLPVRTPTPSMLASSPVYSGDPHYKAPLSSSVSVVASPTAGSSAPADLSSPYRAPAAPKPCLAIATDYIIMQGRDCDDPGCSCKRHPTYAAVDEGSMHTYSSVETVQNSRVNESSQPRQVSHYEQYQKYSSKRINLGTNSVSQQSSHYIKPLTNYNTLRPVAKSNENIVNEPTSLRRTKKKSSKRPPSDYYADRNYQIPFQINAEAPLQNSTGESVHRSSSGPMTASHIDQPSDYCSSGPMTASHIDQPSDYSTDHSHDHLPYFHHLDKKFNNRQDNHHNENNTNDIYTNDRMRGVPSSPSPVLVKYNSIRNSQNVSPNRSSLCTSQNSHNSRSSPGHECFV